MTMRAKPRDSGNHSLRLDKRWAAIILASILMLTSTASLGRASEHDSTMAGHPLRIVAYVLHPVGVVLDYLIFRPAHWIASHEPIQTLVGHED